MLRKILLVVALAGCSNAPPPAPAFCEGTTRFDYDPVRGDLLAAFPDDFYAVPDATRTTGLRLHVDDDNAPWLAGLSTAAAGLYRALGALDGSGPSAGVVLRFSAPVAAFPTGDAASVASNAVMLVDLGEGGPLRVPFEVKTTDDGATMLLWPMRPLRARTRHAVVVTRTQKDAAGDCIAPSPALQALLTGRDVPVALAALAPRYAALLPQLGLAPGDVSAATVFTTGSVEEASLTVAADIATRSFAWSAAPTCTEPAGRPYRACTGSFTAGSYTKDDLFVDGTVQSTYELPVELWLPKTGAGPFPVIVFGHGLAGDRESGGGLARIAAELGIATVALDAVGHGAHPTSNPDDAAPARVLSFFGIDLATATLDPFALRDHLRASTWDKLQLVRLLAQQPTIGGAQLDATRLAYVGLSLGGIMGGELLALSDAFDAAILVVAGGRLSSIVSDAPAFSLILEAMKGPSMTRGDVDALVPLMQTLIDAGDPVNYANHVLHDRFATAGPTPPHLLLAAVIDDETVVNAANHALARALGTPQLAPVVKPVGLVDVLPSGPVAGNLAGNRTAAFFQYDRFTRGAGVTRATHENVWIARETESQLQRFLDTWLQAPAPAVVDPYTVEGTPPLAP